MFGLEGREVVLLVCVGVLWIMMLLLLFRGLEAIRGKRGR
jgi:hypothetical protein